MVCTMAAKTANVMVRVEPSVKEQAEQIMETLGVPASTVINMLYRQIILTHSIPFSVSIPAAPAARDEMNQAQFNAMMERGLREIQAGQSRPAAEVFAELKQGLE